MTTSKSAGWVSCVLVLLSGAIVHGYEDGDALQLQTYVVESAANRPDVTDGLIAATGAEDEWKAAYSRVVTLRNADDETRQITLYLAGEQDSLWISAAVPSSDNGANLYLWLYFDLNNNGILDGTPENPGEYAISFKKLGQATEYGWDGSSWVQNTTATVGLASDQDDAGASGSHVYNFEMKLPLKTSPSAVGNAFLDAHPGDEVGFQIMVDPNDATVADLYWDKTNLSSNNSANWGELTIVSAQASGREMAALHSKSYIPNTTDGLISSDPGWKYAFEKTVTFTDFDGNKLTNSKLYFKEDVSNGHLYFGARVTASPTNSNDYFMVYLDNGAAGGNLDYKLNPNVPFDDAISIGENTGAGDYHWDASGTKDWVSDPNNDVTGAAGKDGSLAWEFEMRHPLSSGDNNHDISITTGQTVGALFRFHDATNNRDYWWSGTINDNSVNVSTSGVYSALGWAQLQTGGPFVQPLYPEQNDIISGTYVLMLYAEDAGVNGWQDIDSVDYRITDLDNNILINYSSNTRMTKVDNDNSGLWASTFNTNTGTTPDGEYNIVFRVLDIDGIRVTSPVRVTIQNTGSVGGPQVTNLSLATGDVIFGDYQLTFEVNPTSGNTIVADSVQVSIDGGTWSLVDSAPPANGGVGLDTITTTSLTDGVHTLKVRAKDTGDQAWGYSELIIFNVNNAGSVPIVGITAPADSAVKSRTVTVRFDATPSQNTSIDSFQMALNGVNWTKTDSDSAHDINTIPLQDGTHIVQVRAFADNGTIGYSQPLAFIVQNGPSVVVTAPTADQVLSGATVVAFDATVSSSIAETYIRVDGGSWETTTTDSTDSLNLLSLTEGTHGLEIRVVDTEGREAISSEVGFVVHNAPTVVLDTTLADSVLRGTVDIAFTITDSTDAIATREISMDGASWRSAGGNSYSLDTRPLTDGAHNVQVRVTDANGKTGLSQILKLIVFNAPIVMIDTLMADSVVRGVVDIAFAVTDSTDSIISQSVSINGANWKATSDYSYSLDTRPLTDGAHNVQVRVTDQSGKTGESQILKLVVKNSPSVEIDTSFADSILSGTVVIPFSITDSTDAIDTREFTLDGDVWKTTDGDSLSIATAALKDGEHTIQVRVTDINGKSDISRALKFIVDNTAPVVSNVQVLYPEGSVSGKTGQYVIVTAYVKDDASGVNPEEVKLSSDALDATPVSLTLTDTGGVADSIAGDFVYTTRVLINTDSTGTIGYSLSAIDNRGNTRTLQSSIVLDNTIPTTSFAFLPEPETDGSTYFDKIVLKGAYDDKGGSGLHEVFISVKNDSGDHVNNSPVVLSIRDTLFSRIVHLIPGTNTIMLVAQDRAGNRDSTMQTVTYFEPKATKVVDDDGGTVETPDGASVAVPEDALLSAKEITITRVDQIDQPKPLNSEMHLLYVARDFGPDGIVFRKPVTLTLPYTEVHLDQNQDGVPDIDQSKLTIVFWDGQRWLKAGMAKVDTTNHTVSVSVNHFTIYDIAVDNDAETPTKVKAFWTRNPVKSPETSMFQFEWPEAGRVSMTILDMAGDVVYQLVDEEYDEAGFEQRGWSGNNVSEQFAGAGIYVYVFSFTPESGGEPTIIRKPVAVMRKK